MHCWGGGAAETASSEKADNGHVTKVNHFYNGMLIQFGGSYHRWLGDDGPQFTLLIAVDDATGCVVNALFCDHEDTSSYFRLMRGLLRRFGIPLALYTDRHPVFKHKSEYQPAGTPTQFGRAWRNWGYN